MVRQKTSDFPYVGSTPATKKQRFLMINQMLFNLKQHQEPLEFHPEGTTAKHTLIVALRALLVTADLDIVLAAIFHDICKPTHGPKHAQAAVDNDDVVYTIKQLGGNLDIVLPLIENHMGCKESISRKGRKVKHIELFTAIDDMIFRKPFPCRRVNFQGHVNADLFFVGQSPLQQQTKKEEITITVNRTPLVFGFKEIPEFFDGELKLLLKILA